MGQFIPLNQGDICKVSLIRVDRAAKKKRFSYDKVAALLDVEVDSYSLG